VHPVRKPRALRNTLLLWVCATFVDLFCSSQYNVQNHPFSPACEPEVRPFDPQNLFSQEYLARGLSRSPESIRIWILIRARHLVAAQAPQLAQKDAIAAQFWDAFITFPRTKTFIWTVFEHAKSCLARQLRQSRKPNDVRRSRKAL